MKMAMAMFPETVEKLVSVSRPQVHLFAPQGRQGEKATKISLFRFTRRQCSSERWQAPYPGSLAVCGKGTGLGWELAGLAGQAQKMRVHCGKWERDPFL